MSDTYYYRNNDLDLSGAIEYMEDNDIFLNDSAGYNGSGRAIIRLDSDYNVLMPEYSAVDSDSDSEDSIADAYMESTPAYSEPISTVDVNMELESPPVPSISGTGDTGRRKSKSRHKKNRGKGPKSMKASEEKLDIHHQARKQLSEAAKHARQNDPSVSRPHPSTYVHSDVIPTFLDPDTLRRTSTGWRGISQKLDKFHASENDPQLHHIPDDGHGNSVDDIPAGCHEEVYRLVREEGYHYVPNKKDSTQIFLDQNDKIYCMKPQPPTGTSYQTGVVQPMNEHLAGDLKNEIDVAFARRKSVKSHSNNAQQVPDESPCLSLGHTHGQGSKRPHKAKLNPPEQKVVNGLKAQPFFQRYVGHVNKTVSDWFPGHNKLYRELLNRYFPRDPDHPDAQKAARDAVDILENSPFSGFSINIGPQALAAIHRDSSNMLNGLCVIGVFGTFDGTKSAHIVLHEAKIIIEVFPGDLIILLSSTITHSNIPMCIEDVKSNAYRHSFVHYTAGGLFQWQWDGKMLHKDIKEKPAKDEGKRRFTEIYNLLPTLGDLLEARRTGIMSDHGILETIQSGNSLLMRANPNASS